jgi:hypothetical protein
MADLIAIGAYGINLVIKVSIKGLAIMRGLNLVNMLLQLSMMGDPLRLRDSAPWVLNKQRQHCFVFKRSACVFGGSLFKRFCQREAI